MLANRIYDLIILIAFAIGLVRFKKLTGPFKILTYAAGVTVLLEILSIIFINKYGNNALIYHFMSACGYIFYAVIYFYLFQNRKIKTTVLISIPVVLIFFSINLLYIQHPSDKQFPTNIYNITNAFQVIFALLLFKQMLQNPANSSIVKQSVFWFNTAVLFFSSTMFLNMALLNYYAENKWGYDVIYYLWQGTFCLLNALIGVSLLLDNEKVIGAIENE